MEYGSLDIDFDYNYYNVVREIEPDTFQQVTMANAKKKATKLVQSANNSSKKIVKGVSDKGGSSKSGWTEDDTEQQEKAKPKKREIVQHTLVEAHAKKQNFEIPDSI